MRSPAITVSGVRFSPAGESEQRTGLLGWVACSYGLVRLDGIAVRQTLDGRLALSFPRGRGKCPPVRPLDDGARRAIERQILEAIDLDGEGVR